MKYYWCVNCGYHGMFEFFRQRNIQCESCGYDSLTEYNETEWKEEGNDIKHQEDKVNPYYDGHLKHGLSRHAVPKVKEKDKKT